MFIALGAGIALTDIIKPHLFAEILDFQCLHFLLRETRSNLPELNKILNFVVQEEIFLLSFSVM